MSDFGSEVGNSGLAIMGKLIDALLKLIGKIYELVKERTSAEYKLKKAEYEKIKDKAEAQKFAEKVEGMAGYVNHDDLVKAGVPLTAVGITLDDEGFKNLAERCKREGIVISGVEDVRERELTGKKSMIVECKQSDLVRLANLVDLMNDEMKIGLVQDEIQKLESVNQELETERAGLMNKGDLTQEETNRIKEISNEIEENNLVVENLNGQISEIRHEHSQELNQEQARGVVEKAVNGETQRGVTFDEAVDRWTGGNLDKDTTCYVVDAKDPNRYIVCNAQNDSFRNKDYIKTTYEVYNGSKQVYATNDGRFEGRPKDYWAREKAAMRDAGGFSDQVIKFYSVTELDSYRELYKAQNTAELDKLDVGKEGRNYFEIIKSLEAKLKECGAEYKDGAVIPINEENGKPITLKENMTDAERANAAEAAVIGKQISNYMELEQLESDVAIARTSVLTTNEGTNEHAAAQSVFEKMEGRYKAALDTEAQLIDLRKSINAVQAAHDVKVPETEKSDDRRDERVSEIGDERSSMAEYKGQIDKKKDDGAKENDVKDRDVNKQATIPKGKEDR